MTVKNFPYHEYKEGDFIPKSDMNRVRDDLSKLNTSLPSECFVSGDGILTRTRRGRASANLKKARIVKTLQRADPTASPALNERAYYVIELVGSEIPDWSSTAPGYFEGDEVKYPPASDDYKVYTCTQDIPANMVSSIIPTSTSHWAESADSEIKAGVFGYYETLLGTAPWFQVDSVHTVLSYDDPNHPEDWTWWLLRTVSKIEEGEGEDKIASLYWRQLDENGNIVGRLCSVYR